MIIENQQDVTTAVLSELQRAPDPRFREIMSIFVRHLHDFVREAKLTEEEFHAAIAYVVALGKHSSESHNEAVLMSGSLGLSALICLLNNGNHGATETDHNMLRAVLAHAFACHAERRLDRAFAHAGAGDVRRCPVPRCERQSDRRCRGRYLALLAGGLLREPGPGAGRHEPARQVLHRRRRPYRLPQRQAAGYPIPIDGPTGDLLRAQGRHNMRPAHLHFLATKDGFKTLISQLYVQDDKFLETDVQFGVTRHLIGNYVRHRTSRHPRRT